MSNDIIIPGDEAYLSFGGWAKPMKNPPGMHERRRYIVDVECTDAGLGASSKGERGRRKLSILRVAEVTGVAVPPRKKGEADDEDDDTPAMFAVDDDGKPINPDDSADEGDEIIAKRAEDKAAAQTEGADETSNDDGDGEPWPGDAGYPAEGTADDVSPEENLNDTSKVTPLFKAADGG